MTVRERTQTVEHRLGTDGTLEIKVPEASVRLRGVDGDTVRGRIDGDDTENIRVEASDGRVVISSQNEWRGFGLGFGLSILGFGSSRGLEIELDVPRSARVVAEVASGDIRGSGMVGQQRYRSASGEIELGGAAGTVEIEAVSGGIRVSGPGPVKVRARTVSGETDVATDEIRALNLATTSGDVRVRGAFDAQGEHRISTVSGDVELDVDGGLRVDASTISGDVRSDVPHRSEGSRGRRSVIVGEGAATLYFKSVSGDLRIRPSGARRHEAVGAARQHVDVMRTDDVPDGDGGPAGDGPPPNMDRIGILEGVERGEISVAEASRWLAILGDDE